MSKYIYNKELHEYSLWSLVKAIGHKADKFVFRDKKSWYEVTTQQRIKRATEIMNSMEYV